MKALIAIDSFKGCLTSAEAGKAALAAFPEGEAEMIPVSDGGEGFCSIVTTLLGGSFRTVECHDPIGRRMNATYGLVMEGRTAVIETAAASGLGLLKESERNPSIASSYGTGEIIADALGKGVEEIWLGLGGSATCDGGTGLLQALGVRFLTSEGVLEKGRCVLEDIHGIDSSGLDERLKGCRITGFYDVNVPFSGDGGAAKMFSPQKGAGPEMADALDKWMSGLCQTYSEESGRDINFLPGSGAAGGIGGAIAGVPGCRMLPGISHILDLAKMKEKLSGCDLIITGEGRADLQTLRGKVPAGVLEYVRRHEGTDNRKKVILLAGKVSDDEALLAAGFDKVIRISPSEMPVSEAMEPQTAVKNIRQSVRNLLDRLSD